MAWLRRIVSGRFGTFLIGAGITVAFFLLDARYPSLLSFVELKADDLRLYARGTRKTTGLVAIAAIDDKSVAQLGRWPWPRSIIAKLVDALRAYDARVIGFDMIFSEADNADQQRGKFLTQLQQAGLPTASVQNVLGPPNDVLLARAIKAQGSVLIGYPLEIPDRHNQGRIEPGFAARLEPPKPMAYGLVRLPPGPAPKLTTAIAYLPTLPLLRVAARGTAYFDTPSDPDGIFRTEMTVIPFDGMYCEPLFMALASTFANGALTSLRLAAYGVAGVSIGPVQIPVDEAGRLLVNFRGPAYTFPYYSASDIIAHRVPAQALAGKIVLVGATALGLGDRWSTPVGSNFPGVEINANAVDNILTGDFVRRNAVTFGIERVGAIAIGLAVSLAVATLSAAWAALAAMVLCLGFYFAVQHLLTAGGLMVGVVFPVATAFVTYGGMISYRYLTEEQDKRYLRHAFEHYLHPGVIEALVKNPRALKLGGERRHLSILFADIKGFTSRAERTDPEELVSLLNTYMTAMIEVIMESGGVVDKLMGDGIMAFWGAPATLENPARNASDCGLRMLATLERLRRTDERFHDFEIGVGIATGEAIVGNFGGQKRFDYSVIGDSVNLASRIEGLTRYFQVPLLVNDQTLAEAGDGYVARTIGLVRVKGKQQPVGIVQVAGTIDQSLDPDFYREFTQAVVQINNGARNSGRAALQKLARTHPGDHPLRLYLERLEAQAPVKPHPAGFWEGLLERWRPKPALPAVIQQPVIFELETK
jgi:adenylate cyclase